MRYISTRGEDCGYGFRDVVSRGLADDGGLYLPVRFPDQSSKLKAWSSLSYQALAKEIFRCYVGDDLNEAQLNELLRIGTEKFRHPEVTPLKCLDNQRAVLELFHGPTFSFKDVALQTLGQLLSWWPAPAGRRTILGATSGDTGSAAIHGVMGKAGVTINILYPEGRVSPIQERQMACVEADNVRCIAVRGDFDDCQALVKEIFSDLDFKRDMGLSAVNSINWSRILSQIVYYFYAYFRWCEVRNRQIGEGVPVCVPTGNFGDIFAGYVAKVMGLPLGKLLIATNENDILCRFAHSGSYAMDGVTATSSPSMDIQVSSNFERLLYLLHDGNADKLNSLMLDLQKKKNFQVEPSILKKFQKDFGAESIAMPAVNACIKKVYAENGYLIDPHTAVGLAAAEKHFSGELFITLSTAHPAKFLDTVKDATDKQFELPNELAALASLPMRKTVIDADAESVRKAMLIG